MTVMSRQPGLSWSDVGEMDMVSFFHLLSLSEKVKK